MDGMKVPRKPKAGGVSRAVFAVALCVVTVGLLAACGRKGGETDRVNPSGLAVPRYVTLKFAEVNARAGPGDDHKLLWIYHAKGLPLQIVAETAEWRRVCDPDGALSWVHKRTVDGRQAAMRLQATPLALHSQPRDSAAVVAYLGPRAVAGLDKCQKGWCRLRSGQVDAWAPASEIWGADERPQCTGAAPSAPAPASSVGPAG
jgi:SH3-like domain-containing protein